uniref:Uncharacterized protein n=1 Tax=Pseudomonas phage HRDY3 TaxID=3236930 RepID=A0AB39CDN8_9VIRU
MNQVNEELNKAEDTRGPKIDLEARLAAEDDASENVRARTPEELDEQLAAILLRDRQGAAVFQQKQRKARWILRIWLFVSTVGLFALLGAVGWTYRDHVVQDWDRYASPVSNCIFKVGDRTVRSTREVSYRYYTVFGWRFYDTKTVEEKNWVELPNSASSVLAHLPDGSYRKITTSDAENGRYPLPIADTYSFFMDNGKNLAVVSYKEMCK